MIASSTSLRKITVFNDDDDECTGDVDGDLKVNKEGKLLLKLDEHKQFKFEGRN